MTEEMPSGYSDAVVSADRTVTIFLSVGLGSDTTAADDLTGVTGSFLEMTNTDQATDAVYYLTPELATFEGYGIKTSVSAGIITPPITATAYPPEVGVWSKGISDADGSIDFTVTLTLKAEHTSAMTIYTEGPAVLEAEMTFTDSEGTSTTKACTCIGSYFSVADTMSYTSIAVHITKLDDAYRHVRIVEVEFGASRAFSNSEIGGEVSIIREIDPTEKSMPMDELDVEVLNVTGELDPDNPSNRLDELYIGQSFTCSFTVASADGTKYTVPCGRYWIGERDSSDTRLSLTAFDARYRLSTIYAEWSISTTESLGKTLEDLLSDYMIPHIVDEDLYEVMPDEDYTFDNSSAISEDLLQVQQAYAVYFVPDRQGSIKVTGTWPADAYGSIPKDTIYSWPSTKQAKQYNYIQIGYKVTEGTAKKTYYVYTDLREDTTEGKSILQISDNDLITTAARATEVMNRLIARLSEEEVESEWRGDPAMDLGDAVQIPGKWTQESPRTYKTTYIEEIYDGTYRATIRGTK